MQCKMNVSIILVEKKAQNELIQIAFNFCARNVHEQEKRRTAEEKQQKKSCVHVVCVDESYDCYVQQASIQNRRLCIHRIQSVSE